MIQSKLPPTRPFMDKSQDIWGGSPFMSQMRMDATVMPNQEKPAANISGWTPCLSPLFKRIKGGKYFEVFAGHGDSVALREITRRWSFHGTRGARRPSAFLCRIPFGFTGESADPGRCFGKSHRHPRAQSKLFPRKQIPKVKLGGARFGRSLTIPRK